MAKDDYFVIVYRVLTYLYACLKRKILFDEVTFQAAVRKHVENDEYFTNVLRLMQEDGMIEGLTFAKAWDGIYLLASEVRDAQITQKGIEYLKGNSRMKKIGQALKEAVDLIASLAGIL